MHVLCMTLGLAAGAHGQAFGELYQRADGIEIRDVEARRQAFAEAYQAFARLAPDSADYRSALGRGAVAAFEAGIYGTAAELFAEQWKRDGGSAALLQRRLQALTRGGRLSEALGLGQDTWVGYGETVRHWLAGVEFPAVMDATHRMVIEGATERLVWVFEALVAIQPDNALVLANLALVLRQLGRYPAAISTYERALRLAPTDAVVWSDLGLLHKGRGDHEAAVEAYRSALRQEESLGTSPACTNLGLLFQRTGKTWGRDPVADLTAVLRLRPQQRLARRLLLDTLAQPRR